VQAQGEPIVGAFPTLACLGRPWFEL
jgi:hypothetical protein